MEFETETPHIFVINEGQHGGMEQHRREESFEQPREEVSGDVDLKKDNLKKLFENKLVMIDFRI